MASISLHNLRHIFDGIRMDHKPKSEYRPASVTYKGSPNQVKNQTKHASP